jgi:hypothetical protein
MPKDEFVAEDPLELIGMVLPGQAGQLEAMAECIVEEYVRMGWDERRLLTLFTNPLFMATHRIFQSKGEDYVRELIRTISLKWRIKETEGNPLQSSVPGGGSIS